MKDPHVIAIKMTLYRIGANSPLINLLIQAAEARQAGRGAGGAQGALRRAEQHHLGEAAGIARHPRRLRLRRPEDARQAVPGRAAGRRRHPALRAHEHRQLQPGHGARSTPTSAYFTADPDIVGDVSDVFNYLTGYSNQKEYRSAARGAGAAAHAACELIKRETEHARAGRPARMILKVNAITDDQMIRVLYRASQAGVAIDLIVRGICSLRPGIPGVSDNIRVRSIVGRFLEHSRIYWFDNGGQEEMYIGSADLMERNLDRRVETLTPDPRHRDPSNTFATWSCTRTCGHRSRDGARFSRPLLEALLDRRTVRLAAFPAPALYGVAKRLAQRVPSRRDGCGENHSEQRKGDRGYHQQARDGDEEGERTERPEQREAETRGCASLRGQQANEHAYDIDLPST